MFESHASGRLVVRALDACATAEALVQQHGELVRDFVLHCARRRNDGSDARIAERIDVRLRRARVEHHELQAALAPEERGQPRGIGNGSVTGAGLEQQPFRPSVSREVEDGNSIAVGVRLEDAHHLLRSRIGERYHVANPRRSRRLERGHDVFQLDRQTSEMPRPGVFIGRRDQEDRRSRLWCRGR